MTVLLTAAAMRAAEGAAIASGRVTGGDLMDRAGRGAVAAMLAHWPDLATTAHRAVVLCGPGNNGGDGFVVASVLRDRGWEVTALLHGHVDRLPPDARSAYDRWIAGAHDRRNADAVAALPDPGAFAAAALCGIDASAGGGPLVLVDALFGLGLARPLAGLTAVARRLARGPDPRLRVLALDLPSGLCSDSGRVLGPAPAQDGALRADLTVTFHRPKPGHVLADGPALCGHLRVAEIGLPAPGPAPGRDPGPAPGPDAALPRLAGPPPALKTGGHKYDHGHAVILSGPSPNGGAARLAARGALRVGAGLVTLASPASALSDHAAQLTAIMLREADGPDALAALLADRRLNAVCLGPGLGTGAPTRALVAAALAAPPAEARAVVLDADALTSFEDDPGALFARLHPRCVLTPHDGEFARLFPDLARRLAEPAHRGPAVSRLDVARDAAARAGATVLLKGPCTVIAHPDGALRVSAAVYDRRAPWLATAGSGDVLAGLVTGLLAQGAAPLDAASHAAWLHVEAARAFGPGLIAEDLPEALPQVFRQIGTR